MTVRLRLARLAGARDDILQKAPGATARYSAMGGVLISTALVAGVSAFFALHTVLALSWQICAAAAGGWAMIILNLDRLLMVSMSSAGSAKQRFGMAVPRLLLAVVIGTVVSTPLVLQIFDREINAELTTMKAEGIAQSKKVLDATYSNITTLEAEENKLQEVIEGRSVPAVTDDPDVKSAQSAFDKAETAYQTAEAAAQCELDGTCGTRRPGVGDSYRQKQQAADAARTARDSAKSQLDAAKKAAARRVGRGQASAVAAAKKKLPNVQTDLAVERERRDTLETEATKTQNGNTGFLARLEALDRLTGGHAMGRLTHWMLFLLFLCIEVLPVLVKLMSSFGPPTLYDRLLARQDSDVEHVEQARADSARLLAQEREDKRLELERMQFDGQIEVGRRATAAIVERQSKIALDAVAVWGNLAQLRADEELNRWYRANVDADLTPHSRTFGPHDPVAGTRNGSVV